MEKKNVTAHRGLIVMTIAGGIAGAGFNLAFGSAPWNFEGILGGLLSGLLVYLVS